MRHKIEPLFNTHVHTPKATTMCGVRLHSNYQKTHKLIHFKFLAHVRESFYRRWPFTHLSYVVVCRIFYLQVCSTKPVRIDPRCLVLNRQHYRSQQHHKRIFIVSHRTIPPTQSVTTVLQYLEPIYSIPLSPSLPTWGILYS